MPIRIAIDHPRHLGSGIWVADIHPQDISIFGTPKEHYGGVSVVFLPESNPPDEMSSELSLDPHEIRVLNLGKASRAVIIFGGNGQGTEVADKAQPIFQGDDPKFLKETNHLPAPLRVLGPDLLKRVRAEFHGYFEQANNGRFVNRPDNFYTIKIQPRDESYAVTVRGYAHEFQEIPGIKVHDDRRGYCRFKISEPSQLEPALEAIQKSGRRQGKLHKGSGMRANFT